jgi:hypothetical protein
MSIIGLSMGAFPCCAKEDVEAGSAALRVDWPVYPRRAEHNTVAEGGNRRRPCIRPGAARQARIIMARIGTFLSRKSMRGLRAIPYFGVRRCECSKGVFSRVIRRRAGALGASPLFRRALAARSFPCRNLEGAGGTPGPAASSSLERRHGSKMKGEFRSMMVVAACPGYSGGSHEAGTRAGGAALGMSQERRP